MCTIFDRKTDVIMDPATGFYEKRKTKEEYTAIVDNSDVS